MRILNRQLIAMMGPPCSGKNIVHELLVNCGLGFGFGASKALREYAASNPEVQRLVDHCASKGELAPDELMVKVFQEAIQTSVTSGENLITEGLFRSRCQFRGVFDFLSRHWCDEEINAKFVFFDVSDEVCLQRFKLRSRIEERMDNRLEVFRNRLKMFRRSEVKLRRVAEDYGDIIEINGGGSLPPRVEDFLNKVHLGLSDKEKAEIMERSVLSESRLQKTQAIA